MNKLSSLSLSLVLLLSGCQLVVDFDRDKIVDASLDMQADRSVDAQPDAEIDAEEDTTTDVVADTVDAMDAGDSSEDALDDASDDLAVDALDDAPEDTTQDMSLDAIPDMMVDAILDMTLDADAEPECTMPAQCDDTFACTVDSCDNLVCMNVPSDALCDDGIGTTTNGCLPADARANADGCVFGCLMVSDCDDAIVCTVEACDSSACTSTPTDSLCDDGNAATTDTCAPDDPAANSMGCTNI